MAKMKHLVIKLDDIGRDSSRPVIDIILWSMQKKVPISIGTIGRDLYRIPRELVDLVGVASRSGFLEIWNHGFQHVRYDQVAQDVALEDLKLGHEAILDTFGIQPDGFGFPFNHYTEDTVRLIRQQFPEYFIYESDFGAFKLLSPEFNSFADGQPRASYFLTRVGMDLSSQNILLQAHPPRWSKVGLEEFIQCIKTLIETRGYICLSAKDALLSSNIMLPHQDAEHPSAISRVVQSIAHLHKQWDDSADLEYTPRLSNFKSYFLARFNSDTQKNWHQVRAELYPFRPQRILDLGCGLGNWSLPFFLSGEAKELTLNDVNTTIINALSDGVSSLFNCDGISVDSRNLLTAPVEVVGKFDYAVSANTFNYIDPVDFFHLAQACVVPGGRLLLMVQTPAFNRLRYRLALESRDCSMAAEVLASDFSMLLRKHYSIFPHGTRHAYPCSDINRLANMFDFTLLSSFTPYGERLEDGESVYQCLLFKKTVNMRNAISNRQEWLDECHSTIGGTFGSKAFDLAQIPISASTKYFNYYEKWLFDESLSDSDRNNIEIVKYSINSILQGDLINICESKRIASQQSPLATLSKLICEFGTQSD